MLRRLFALVLCAPVCCARADVSVLTQHGDAGRTGADLNETRLNTGNVNSNRFGLLWKREVDDQLYAQPLVMTNVDLGARGIHNLVILATANDSVYAYDADDASATAPYWKVSFLGPEIVAPQNQDMTGACGGEYSDFSGNIGIVSTPVIEPARGTLYLVARTKEQGTNFVQRLHALDLRTGAERPNSPVVITGTFPGHGDGSDGGVLRFDPLRQNQRPALALVKGVVYLAWASHCDWGPYHGWLMGYDAATLRQTAVFNTTPEGGNGGIWMSGQGPAADAEGNLYVSVGNGSVGRHGHPGDPINRGESLLKLTPRGSSMELAGWFTPYNWLDLENTDSDFGNAGVLLVPSAPLALCGSKDGKIYLVNRDHLGGLSQDRADTNIVQTIQITTPRTSSGLFGAAVWWDGPDGSYAYLWCKQDFLRQYKYDFATGKLIVPEIARGNANGPAPMPGGLLAVSADGKRPGTGIVWATHTLGCDGNHNTCPGVLHAYDAQNVAYELWNSQQVSARDAVGNLAKFVAPTVANGKVYLATFSNRLNVYGLFP